jgi:LuxR family transcriptional regulator, maltose regulon positive regulatory protein
VKSSVHLARTSAHERYARAPAAADLGLMTTKFARPRLPPGYVARSQVDALIDQGTRGPVTLVCAGAGWGKTLATAAWAAAGPAVGDVAWVSLDATDNQPRTFWSYLVAALRAATHPPAANPLAHLVPGLGSDEETLQRLVAGLGLLPKPVVLVLDDFDVITDPVVIDGLSRLLRVPVLQLRLVLLTRGEPSLSLHRLRLAGQLVEIRARDLALSSADAASLIVQDGVVLQEGESELLVQRTEGWPAGLRLAAMFLGRRDGGKRAAVDFGGDDQAVSEYLAEEVLSRHPTEVQRFLLLTSIAERVNGALAKELTGDSRGQEHLEVLAGSNTFVVGLGPGREWYRYHTLMQQMLRHRLTTETPDIVPDLHRRAAHWFSAHGHSIEALRHAADAEDWELLGRLLVTQALPLAVSVDRAALDLVLARVPSHRLADSPELALAAATLMLNAGRFEAMEPHLARAERQMSTYRAKTSPGTRIGHLLLSTAVSRSRGDNDAVVRSAESALEELSGQALTMPAARGYRASALSNLGTGLLWSGRLAEAEKHLVDGLAEAEGTALDASRVNMLAHLALVEALSDRLGIAHSHASQATTIVRERGWAPLAQAATAYLALGVVHLQRNALDDATAALAEGQTVAALDRAPRCAMGLLEVRISASLGQVDTARTQMQRLRRELGDWEPPDLLARWVRIADAEIDLAAGDPAAALGLEVDAPEARESLRAPERLVRARALLLVGEPRKAEHAVAPLHDPALGNSSLVEAWVLTALAADRLREDRRANEALLKALLAAEPEGIRRPFTAREDGPLPRLLNRVKALHPSARRFIQQLETEMTDVPTGLPAGGTETISLTDRELSVLQYLPTLMTYPEIAAHLFISVNTLKSHIRSIYVKLGVVSRRQAVHRAIDLGLLEP